MISLYRTKIKMESWLSRLIFRLPPAVVTSFTLATEASRFCRDHQPVQASLVRSDGAPSLTRSYLVDMLYNTTYFSIDKRLVENGLQQIPLAGTAVLEPADLLRSTSSCPRLRVLVA